MCYLSQIKGITTLLVLDFLWIYLYMGGQYNVLVPRIQGSKMVPNLYSAVGAYTLMIYLLVQVVIKYNMSLLESFLFGFAVYGVYDLTCGGVFKNWDFNLAFIDMVWGGTVYMLANYASKL